jgi:hypothetical protein
MSATGALTIDQLLELGLARLVDERLLQKDLVNQPVYVGPSNG